MPSRHYFAQLEVLLPSSRLEANALWFLPSALAHSLFVNVRVGVSPSALPSTTTLLATALLLLRLGLCLRFVKMEMKKICTVAAFVAFFRADADVRDGWTDTDV